MIPHGIPIPRLNKPPIKPELKEHINIVMAHFQRLSKKNLRFNYNSVEIKELGEYQINDVELFGFRTTGYELREHANLTTGDFYEKCILQPISQLQNQVMSEYDINSTYIMRTIQTLTNSFGLKEILLEVLCLVIVVVLMLIDIMSLQMHEYRETGTLLIETLIIIRICLICGVLICRLSYSLKPHRVVFYLSYVLVTLLMAETTLTISVMDIANQPTLVIVKQITITIISCLYCLVMGITLYHQEINIQRLRVLLGGKYQSVMLCC